MKQNDDLKTYLLNEITDLLVDEQTKPKEREILLNAKRQLENGESAQYVANLIRVGLDPMAWQSQLSKNAEKLYATLISRTRPAMQRLGAVDGAALGLAFADIIGK